MRLFVIADIEDLRWKHGVGEADILRSCGDVSDHVIMEAADAFKCHAIFAVKGNHDSADPFPEPIVDLHRSSKKMFGRHIWRAQRGMEIQESGRWRERAELP
jgi:predicted phosphodiesterase